MLISACQPACFQSGAGLSSDAFREPRSQNFLESLKQQDQENFSQQPASNRPTVVQTGRYRPLPGRRIAGNLSIIVRNAAGSGPLGLERTPPIKGDSLPKTALSEKLPYQFSINGVPQSRAESTFYALGGGLELRIVGTGQAQVNVPGHDGGEPVLVYKRGQGVMGYPAALAAQLTISDIRIPLQKPLCPVLGWI